MPGGADEAGRTHGAVERPTARGDRGVLGLRKTRSVRVGLGKKRAWITHAQVVVLGAGEAAAVGAVLVAGAAGAGAEDALPAAPASIEATT